MSMLIENRINEWDIGHWIRQGELRLEHIIQAALGADEITAAKLTAEIQPMRGTADACKRAEAFAKAMQSTYAAPGASQQGFTSL